jgi:predicted nucleotide-binding protein
VLDMAISPLPMTEIVNLANPLDIDIQGWENTRSHWSIKDVDLIDVLAKHRTLPKSIKLPESNVVPTVSKSNIFIVHGRERTVKFEVGLWVRRIGLEEIILHDQPSLGRTLISKFQECGKDAAFAIVIMTPDDMGGLLDCPQQPRSRQNVIFELGFFIAKLGADRVAVLITDSAIEKPSDYDGVVYITYDIHGAWKRALAREFTELQIPFDMARAF